MNGSRVYEDPSPPCRVGTPHLAPSSDIASPAGMKPDNPVAARLADLRRRGRKAFAPFVMAGYPSLPATKELLFGLAAAGADLIELGLPFSDPLADGPVNQAAAHRALAGGATLDRVFSLLAETAPVLPCPVMLFTYYNPLLQRGPARFLGQATAAGASGLVIPDLPPEAAGGIAAGASRLGLGLSFLIAPTSTEKRIGLAARGSTAFLYAVSLRGVTGERRELPPDLPVFLRRARRNAHGRPILIGFGIGNPAQARQAARLADGIIAGSVLVRLAGEKGAEAACELAREMRAAVDRA